MNASRSLPLLTWLVVTVTVIAPVWGIDPSARRTYNNKMTLIGVLREGARQRAEARGDLETLCLILGIGLDVTDRFLTMQATDQGLLQRRRVMEADLNTCLQTLKQRTAQP